MGIQCDGGGAQTEPADFQPAVQPPVAVQVISQQGVSKCGHMGPDLVRPSGQEMDLQQADIPSLHGFVGSKDMFCAGKRGIYNADAGCCGIF